MLSHTQHVDANFSNKKAPSCLENLSLYFTEYCDNTSIHGLKYLGERGRFIVEKIWWITCLAISISFCVFLINKVYHRWETSPVIVSFATTQTPIWKIPFPAVTICPETKSLRKKYNFTGVLLSAVKDPRLSTEDYYNFEYMSLICSSAFSLPYQSNIDTMLDEQVVEFLLEVAPPFDEDILLTAKWMGNEVPPNEIIFVPTLTSEGICYTFNLLNRDDIFTNETNFWNNFGMENHTLSMWSLETGYLNDAELHTYPRRTLLDGMSGGLELILGSKIEDIDSLCGESLYGFKVILHHPGQVPRAEKQYFLVPLDEYVVAAIKPNMMTTSDDLKSYTPEERRCYFTDEKKLRFFKIYNQENCLLECLANFTYNYCDCVSFYMPRAKSTPICNTGMFGCVTNSSVMFLSEEMAAQIKKENKSHRRRTTAYNNCNCLPSCNALEFSAETSQTRWDWEMPMSLLGLSGHTQGYRFSRLKVFFKDLQFITSERDELYGQTDFWANCGGLLGLFTGFSFISLAEILYFLSLRLICNIIKFGQRYWSGSKQLIEVKGD